MDVSFVVDALLSLVLTLGIGALLLYLMVTGRDSRLVWGLAVAHLVLMAAGVVVELIYLLS